MRTRKHFQDFKGIWHDFDCQYRPLNILPLFREPGTLFQVGISGPAGRVLHEINYTCSKKTHCLMKTRGIQHRIVISCIIKEYIDDASRRMDNPYVNQDLSRRLHDKFINYFTALAPPEGMSADCHSVFLLNPALKDFESVLRQYSHIRHSVVIILFSGNGAVTSNFDIEDYDGPVIQGDSENEGMRFSDGAILWDVDFNNWLAQFDYLNDIYFIPDCCYGDGLTIRGLKKREDWQEVKAQAFCVLPDISSGSKSVTNPNVVMAFNDLFCLVETPGILYRADKLDKYLNVYLEKYEIRVTLKHYNKRFGDEYPLFSVVNLNTDTI